MNYVVFHKQFPHQDRRYFKSASGARRSATCSNRNAGCEVYDTLEETLFLLKYPVGKKVVKNLMTGQDIEIAEDTPYCCDPSSERYWSM
jgi:hypothetical protein